MTGSEHIRGSPAAGVLRQAREELTIGVCKKLTSALAARQVQPRRP